MKMTGSKSNVDVDISLFSERKKKKFSIEHNVYEA